MKEYRQMPAVVESVGHRKARVRASLQTEGCGPQWPRSSNPSQDAEEVLSGFLKITQHAMVKRRSWVNIAVCPCLHPSLTHHRNINPFENKVWEIHIFIKKWVPSFIEVRKLCLIMFPLVYVCGYTTFIFLSNWIAKSQKIVAPFASVIGFIFCLKLSSKLHKL